MLLFVLVLEKDNLIVSPSHLPIPKCSSKIIAILFLSVIVTQLTMNAITYTTIISENPSPVLRLNITVSDIIMLFVCIVV